MKHVLLLVLMMAFVNPSEAREPATENPIIATVMGQVENANSRTLSNIVACGYELTKGHAYQIWGPSVTFFVIKADGTRKELYKMKQEVLKPIQTLNVNTANKEDYIRARFYQTPTAYRAEYRNKEIAATKALILDRVFKTYDRFKSSFDTEIKRISFIGWDQQLAGLLGKDQTDKISCVF